MKCLQCGKEFEQRTVTQRYCCTKCRTRHNKEYVAVYPSITFECAQCGKKVVTEEWWSGKGGRPDMRTRFCCQTCEKKFWRHQQKEDDCHTADRRTNFVNFEAYVRYERRTNAI